MILPNNLLAERVLIASCLNNNQEHVNQLVENIVEDDLFDQLHKKILKVVYESYGNKQIIDTILISETLKNDQDFQKAGGFDHLEEIKNKFVKSDITDFIKVVKELSVKRLRIKLYSEAQLSLLEEKPDSAKIVSQVDSKLFLLNSASQKNKLIAATDIANSPLQTAYANMISGKKFTGIRTYFHEFDILTLGIQSTDSVTIAAESSSGKTSFATSIIANQIRFDPLKVTVLFSLEMSQDQILNRIYADLAGVNSLSIRSGFLTKEEWKRVITAKKLVQASNLYIDETGGIRPLEVYAKLNQLLMKGTNPDIVFLDYIQLMTPDSKQETRNLEIASISNSIKNFAKELKFPFVKLSQLSRQNGTNGKRRGMDRIRDSGTVAEESDIVAILTREEIYQKTDDNFGKAVIMVEKNRNGPTGEVPLCFVKPLTRFINIVK